MSKRPMRQRTGERQMNGVRGWRRWSALLTAMLVALAWTLTSPPPPSVAVVGGEPISIERAPWQALVVAQVDGARLCGGVIIDPEWIATAAHCVAGVSPALLEVNVGVDSLRDRGASTRVPVSNVVVHPAWDPTKYRNDIAILQLSTPLSFGSTVAPLSLPLGIDSSTWPSAGDTATISGFGATRAGGQPSNELRAATIRILGDALDAACGLYAGDFFVDVEICAGLPEGGVDACQGDSGGPLVVEVAGRPVLAGITSFGGECARAGYPGIYTRITTFVPWLQGIVPSASLVPSAPVDVRVEAVAGERLIVQWQAPSVGPQPASYLAVTKPGGEQCQVAASELACIITDVTAGKLYEVVVTSLLPDGAEVSAEPVQAVSVNGVTSTGVTVKPRRLARWAGLSVRARDDVRLAVRPGSRNVCKRAGTSANPRGVRTNEAGLCAVRVSVIRTNGKTSRSIAYLDVRQR